MVADENVWLTQEMIATLYNKGRSTITEHLNNIFNDTELDENSVRRKFRRTESDGKKHNTKCYNLEVVIAVGFRTNSEIAKSFAESQFEKYRITQDRLFQSDSNKFAKDLLE